MVNLAQYGLEENIGLHVVLSNFFWWVSVALAVRTYWYRHLWNVGEMPWAFLFLTFISFGIRELGHFSSSLYVGSARYLFGIWSAIFMAAAFTLLYVRLCLRKKYSLASSYAPFGLAFAFLVAMLYLYFSGTESSDLKRMMSIAESLVWMLSSLVVIYTAYMLGTHTTGGFVRVFMFFQFSAYAAFIWKLLGLIEIVSSPIPYSIRELVETVFGIFAIVSMYFLAQMLKELSRYVRSE